MRWSPMGAPRLYWWWDAICPVCHPLSSYSYAIHTVSPPRPLIPVSRGGVQTGKQTGGWTASLFRSCSTRRAWRSISHLRRFSIAISVRLQNKGFQVQVEILLDAIMYKCMSSDVQKGTESGFHFATKLVPVFRLGEHVRLYFGFICTFQNFCPLQTNLKSNRVIL